MKFLKLILLLIVLICCTVVFIAADEDEEVIPQTPPPPSEAPKPKVIHADDTLTKVKFTEEDEKALEASKESYQFQAEVNRLMDIIINSLYKNKEVFLRELISNASDALDKIRFLALSNPSLMDAAKDLEIRISADYDKKTLTIRDTGVGMTKNQLVENLGTVAKSGTGKFAEQLADGGDMSLIGQFGVGFYSVYLVADKVRVVSKHPEDDQYIWESTADSAFNVAKDPRGDTLGRGTEITLYLKEDSTDYVNEATLQQIITKHSEFINFPIYLYKKTTETVEIEEEEEEEGTEETDDESSEDDIEVEEEEEEEKPTPAKTEQIEKWDWYRANNNVAIWARDKEEVTDEEYRKFFKAISKDPSQQDALTWIHFKAEGEVEFRSILFVPSETGNLYDEYKGRKAGIRLYVRKVLIQDDFEDLLPNYLNFIRGVVDSDDLPLNVSRETLQAHKVLKIMAKKLVRKVLEMLRKLSNGESTEDSEFGGLGSTKEEEGAKSPYIKFWETYSKSIKMGVIEDTQNRSKLTKLLRYKSTKTADDEYISLDEYVKNFKEWQKDIYYIAGESLETLKKSPFLEIAKKKDVDVLLLADPLDEYTINHMADYEGHRLQSLTKEGLKFGDEDADVVKKRAKAYKDNFKPLTKYLKDLFAGKISKVVVSQRVETSPAVVVTSQFGHTANMERIMKAQTLASSDSIKQMTASRTLEINPRHPIIIELNKLVSAEATEDQTTKDLAYLLLDTAMQSSGFVQDEPEAFAARVHRTMAASLSISSLDLADEITVEDDDEEEETSTSESAPEAHDEF